MARGLRLVLVVPTLSDRAGSGLPCCPVIGTSRSTHFPSSIDSVL